jgi:hypothetical protein
MAYATPLCLPENSGTASNHPHDDHDAHGKKHDHKNCSKVELPDFGSNPVLAKSVSVSKVFQIVLIPTPIILGRGFIQDKAIRGPPPDWGGIKTASILLTTARFRI